MRIFIISIIAILSLALSSQVTFACTTQPIAPAGYDRGAEVDVVFKGKALETKKKGDFNITVFEVLEKKKGKIIGRKVTVKHRTKQKFCQMAVHFSLGQDHEVYATRRFWGGLYIKPPSYMNP